MKKLTMSFCMSMIFVFGSLAFSRSPEWNLNRYEATYVKIKESIDKGDLENVKLSTKGLLDSIRQAEHGSNNDPDVDLLKLASHRLSRSKSIEEATKELAGLTKIIERWKKQN